MNIDKNFLYCRKLFVSKRPKILSGTCNFSPGLVSIQLVMLMLRDAAYDVAVNYPHKVSQYTVPICLPRCFAKT